MAKQDLQLVLLPGRGPAPGGAEYYLEAYRLWKLVWKATLLELDGSDELYSDHFTRQDYVLCLFHGARCVALTCFRRADLGYATHQEDSWFKPWPKEMLDQIGRELRQGLVVSWVTIDPDYRRTQANAYTKDLEISPRLAEALNFFMRDCEVDIAFGVTRNNRSVNKFCAYAGSQALQTNASLHGVDVDLIAWYPEGLRTAMEKYTLLAHAMWRDRIVFWDKMLQVSQPGNRNKVRLAA